MAAGAFWTLTIWFQVTVLIEEGYGETAGEWSGKAERQLKQKEIWQTEKAKEKMGRKEKPMRLRCSSWTYFIRPGSATGTTSLA